MIALNTTSKKQLVKALERAETQNLKIQSAPGFDNVFWVSSSNGFDAYQIIIGKTNGIITADCTCEAGQKSNMCCKHAALSLKTWKYEQLAKRQAANPGPAKCKACGDKPATSKEGYCEDCQVAKDRNDLFN